MDFSSAQGFGHAHMLSMATVPPPVMPLATSFHGVAPQQYAHPPPAQPMPQASFSMGVPDQQNGPHAPSASSSSSGSFVKTPFPFPSAQQLPASTHVNRKVKKKKSVDKAKAFVCNFVDRQGNRCGAAFNTKFSFKRHQKRHSGARPYRCEFCGRRFAENSTKKRHMRTHTGARPYQCAYKNCGKTFADRTNIRRHVMIHKAEDPAAFPEGAPLWTKLDDDVCLPPHMRAKIALVRQQEAAAAAAAASSPSGSVASDLQMTLTSSVTSADNQPPLPSSASLVSDNNRQPDYPPFWTGQPSSSSSNSANARMPSSSSTMDSSQRIQQSPSKPCVLFPPGSRGGAFRRVGNAAVVGAEMDASTALMMMMCPPLESFSMVVPDTKNEQ